MATWLILVIALVVLLAFAVAAVLLRTRAAVPPVRVREPSEDFEERQQRQRAVESLGRDLLDRRVALDARRGPLQGNMTLDEELDDLERSFRSGEITEDEFERRKIRLLGG